MTPDDPPRLLSDFQRPPGRIKADYTDFQVEELPLYPFDGAGTHVYFLLEKAGLSTMQAVRDIARALNVKQHDIGFAGLKDARAVTRQWLSLEHIDPARLAELNIPRLRIVEHTRHRNKLRLGHLAANQFLIRVRETDTTRLADLEQALQTLNARGVPNYFGEQRFGYRGDTWAIGQAILQRNNQEALDLILGRPAEVDGGPIRRAREHYEQGDHTVALQLWPRMFHAERRALRTLIQSNGNVRRALQSIDRATRSFYVSAFQSHLFNQVVAERLPTGLDRLQEGDLAWRHANGAVFQVLDVEIEQPRADSFEISPTGPLFGYRMSTPTGAPAASEQRVFDAVALREDAFRGGSLRIKGGRRPLRFQPQHPQVALGADERGPYLEVRFTLPRGTYATSVLRELFDLNTDRASADEADHSGTEEFLE